MVVSNASYYNGKIMKIKEAKMGKQKQTKTKKNKTFTGWYCDDFWILCAECLRGMFCYHIDQKCSRWAKLVGSAYLIIVWDKPK